MNTYDKLKLDLLQALLYCKVTRDHRLLRRETVCNIWKVTQVFYSCCEDDFEFCAPTITVEFNEAFNCCSEDIDVVVQYMYDHQHLKRPRAVAPTYKQG